MYAGNGIGTVGIHAFALYQIYGFKKTLREEPNYINSEPTFYSEFDNTNADRYFT